MCISEVPMLKPVAGVEVGLINGSFIINPTKKEMSESTLQLTVAGTKDGILMIEGAADFLSEEQMVEALRLGHQAVGEICDGLAAFQLAVGKAKKLDTLRMPPKDLLSSMELNFGDRIDAALSIGEKHVRGFEVAQVEQDIVKRYCDEKAPKTIPDASDKADINEATDAGTPMVTIDDDDMLDQVALTEAAAGVDEVEEDEASELPKTSAQELRKTSSSSSVRTVDNRTDNMKGGGVGGYGYDPIDVKITIKKLLVRRLRSNILNTGKRPDGRSVEEVRPIDIDTNILPGAHGSALFTRGETQALATATLGSKTMEARFETVDELGTKRFYLQYSFPPSSVGEVGRVGGINRREVGHGNLAERALLPAIPDSAVFPYSIRAESLITESCGSSSMATVCGCCLAMLDAGVPLKSSVAGVAMGLILGDKDGDEPVILTDILGLEDALGTMDFKVLVLFCLMLL